MSSEHLEPYEFLEIEFRDFSKRARNVMQLAHNRAHHFRHEFVGTEHILFAFAEEWGGVGAIVLKNLGVEQEAILRSLDAMIQLGPEDAVLPVIKPVTPRVNKVIAGARTFASQMNRDYVGTDDLLVGMLTETEGLACTVLNNLPQYITLERVKAEIHKLLNPSE